MGALYFVPDKFLSWSPFSFLFITDTVDCSLKNNFILIKLGLIIYNI